MHGRYKEKLHVNHLCELRPRLPGTAQIMALTSHEERYNDTDKAHLWEVTATTK